MEQHRFPKRSTSHGTLRGGYGYHGRPSPRPSSSHPVRPFHKPLRSVNENSSLLPSPGALESMLKTTTETGDIGIFSIKPITTPRRRGTFSDMGQSLQPQPRPRRSVDELYGHYHRNRDTTSELLSMYTCDSQRSFRSDLSPASTEEPGLRSVSMTTYGSRGPPRHGSITTLQSQGSGSSQLQRPRSPFPYPTRLKRPGVRPVSPALTDTGLVDYSRMVEIDRISLRTLHGAYGPIHPPRPRRQHHGRRMDAYERAPPLPNHGQQFHRQHYRGPPSFRSQSAASVAPRNPAHQSRYGSTSSRSSSLASVVNKYEGAPQPRRVDSGGVPFHPQPIYYDYTEQFEPESPGDMAPMQLPPPMAMGDANDRPLMYPYELDGRLATSNDHTDAAYFDGYGMRTQGDAEGSNARAVFDESEAETNVEEIGQEIQQLQSYGSSVRSQGSLEDLDALDMTRGSFTRKRDSDIDLLPSQIGRDSTDTFNPSLDIESKDAPAYDYSQYRGTPKTNEQSPGKPIRAQGNETPSIRSEQGLILQDNIPVGLPGNAEKRATDLRSGSMAMQDGELGNLNERRSISEPTQNSPGKFDNRRDDQRFDARHTTHLDDQECTSLLQQANDLPHGSVNDSYARRERVPKGSLLPPRGPGVVRTKERGLNSLRATPEADDTQEFRHHKRNKAALRISTRDLPRTSDEILPHMIPKCSTTAILSPKPISPVRQLKVKNSIPQLMKALPPLPGDPNYRPPSSPLAECDEDQCTDILSPFNFARPFTLGLSKGPNAVGSVPNLRADNTLHTQRSIPKLRLRMRLSETASPISSDNGPLPSERKSTEKAGLLNDKPLRNPKRFKLRTSRKSSSSGVSPATVRHNPAAQNSNLAAEIMTRQPKDLFTLKTGVNSAIRQVGRKLSQTGQTSRLGRKATSSGWDVSRSDPKRRPSRIQSGYSQLPKQDMPLDRGKPRRLRKRLPNIRRLLEHSSDISTGTGVIAAPTVGSFQEQDTSNSGSKTNVTTFRHTDKDIPDNAENSSHEPIRSHLSHRMRTKLRKWVEGAKLAVRSLANRSHEV